MSDQVCVCTEPNPERDPICEEFQDRGLGYCGDCSHDRDCHPKYGHVVSLSKFTNDATMRSPKQCLQECIEDIGKRGAFKAGKKMLVLMMDDTDGCYHVSFAQAGMKMSECVSLCEVGKTIFLSEMEYIKPGP